MLLFIWGLLGCSEPEDKRKLLEKGRFALQKSVEWILTDEGQTQPIKLELHKKEAIITFDKGKQRILGHYIPKDEIKYLNQLGDILAYMRYTDEHLVFYNADKKATWYVKILPDRVQISDNSKNSSPFEIRLAENGSFKVHTPSKLIGDVKCKEGILTAKGNKRYETPMKANHPAFGVLLLNDITEEWRLIIWTELLRY